VFTKSLLFPLFLIASLATAHADPQITSWSTNISSKYARIYTSVANRTAGTSATTWTNGTLSQSSPAYAGVNEIDVSTDYVYILSTGLGGHVMGPWSNPNLPKNQQDLWRFPRTPLVPTTNRTSTTATPTTTTSLGAMGFMVDGVAAYNTSDGFSYLTAHSEDASPSNTSFGNGDGVWNRDAFVNEAPSFDNALAHSQQGGEYHYHVNPLATRYLVGDNITYNSSTKQYAENTATTTFTHSPILGWMKDGLPLYGPYGYDGGGTGATATSTLGGGVVSSVAVANAGTYTAAPTVTFSSGSATATTSMKVVSAVVSTAANSSAGGTGYKVGDVLTIAGGSSTIAATLTVTSITGSGSGPIATLTITQAGSYTVVPPNYVSVTGGSGSNATLTLIWGVKAVNPTSGGSGYATTPTVTIGGVRRMISGYQLRDGTNSTTNLSSAGRDTLAAWALAAQGRTIQITSTQFGPPVNSTYPLGHYAEDYDYLGDLGYTQGSRSNTGNVFFDLDGYNTRFCITPDFPNGTWAYFTTITSSGTSFYPYSVGRWYRGNPNNGGGSTTASARTTDGATTQFLGGANTAITLGTPSVGSGSVTLTWSSVEGGTYSVVNSPDDSNFTTKATGLTPTNVPTAPTVGNSSVTTTTSYSTSGLAGTQFARATRTALATYDSAGQTAATVSQTGTTTYALPSNVATLSGLTLSAGTLSPVFASGTTSYTATVVNTASIAVTPTASQANATITVNNTTVSSGVASGSILLNSGSNAITIAVTAQDGVTTQNYTVTVTSDTSPVITNGPPTTTGTIGVAYSFTFTASGVPAPSFSVSMESLPPGLTLSSAGVLSGTPTQAGTYTGTVQASNGAFPNATQNFSITIPAGQTFSEWEMSYSISSGATATPENDGVPNLFKYLYDINPTEPMSAADRAALPALGTDTTTTPGTTYLTLTYRQYSLITGVTINLQSSPDLQTWTTVTPAISQQMGIDPVTKDPIMEVGVNSNGVSRQFIRLNVTSP
jgi:hypothetical protein